MLRLAEAQSILASANVSQVRHRYALSDHYYFHTDKLPKNRVLMLTNNRIMLLVRDGENYQCRIRWQVRVGVKFY